MRASARLLKSTAGQRLIASGIDIDNITSDWGSRLDVAAIEANPMIAIGSHVLSIVAFPISPDQRVGLQMRFSDGSALHVLPAGNEPDSPSDAELPSIADWELITPAGALSVGPAPEWSFRANDHP